jgi:hypothetical protein
LNLDRVFKSKESRVTFCSGTREYSLINRCSSIDAQYSVDSLGETGNIFSDNANYMFEALSINLDADERGLAVEQPAFIGSSWPPVDPIHDSVSRKGMGRPYSTYFWSNTGLEGALGT